jgi:hypothetical protein
MVQMTSAGSSPSGGGRKAAAGINALAQESLANFIDRFNLQFGKAS